MSAETLTVPTPLAGHAPVEVHAVDQQRARLVGAALRCVARWGVAKTSLDDVAREAGVSRATLYRLFPGGRDALFDAVVGAEIERFFREVSGRLETATTLEDLLVAGIHESGRRVLGHPALQYLLAHEPEIVLPKLAFHGFDGVLRAVGDFAAPYLGLWLAPDDVMRAADWVTRLVVSYVCTPAADVDLADEASVRRLVRAFVLPGLVPST